MIWNVDSSNNVSNLLKQLLKSVHILLVLITSPTTCQDVVDLLYNLYKCCTNALNPQQIEVAEFALNALIGISISSIFGT